MDHPITICDSNNCTKEDENNTSNVCNEEQLEASVYDKLKIKDTLPKVVARMPVEKNARYYNMNHKRRGRALIFNHETFESREFGRRRGTDQDCKSLEKNLKQLGFEVSVFQDLKRNEVESEIKKASTYDHSDCDAICICVLTHGHRGVLCAKDFKYQSDELWSPFTADNCPTLAGKPKIFFLQACQGDKTDSGVILSNVETDSRKIESYAIPSQADFLIVYSTAEGYASWRHSVEGSWFIKTLCEELEKHAFVEDLVTLLTFVSQRVALEFESFVPFKPEMHEQKQIPCIMSRLTRLIKFTKVEE